MKRKLGNAEIALAMELRTEGIHLANIAIGLGVTRHGLTFALKRGERNGIGKEAAPVCSRIRSAYVNSRAEKILEKGAGASQGDGLGTLRKLEAIK